jgi:ZIP family zinc transporter
MIALEAGAWGAIGASCARHRALIAILRPIPKWPLGMIMAFGSGVLISSVAFELVEEAVAIGGQLPMALGLALGAIVFYLGDRAIDSLGAEGMGSVKGPESPESGLAIVLGAALDGVPESIVSASRSPAGRASGSRSSSRCSSRTCRGIAGTPGS